jgi:hypothetical protein
MLNLELFAGSRWIDLVAGVRVEVLPLGTTLMSEVWTDPALDVATDLAEGGEVAVPPVVFAKAIARRAIMSWEGVGDAEGRPVAVSTAGIDALMEVPAIHAAFRKAYISPGLSVVAEGNGSAAAPNGISATAVAPTAKPARRAATPAPMTKPTRKASKGGRSGT